MSENKNTGGFAFPRTAHSFERGVDVITDEGDGGMTMRDWFAGMALQGLFAHYGNDGLNEGAKAAYAAADEMLKAR